MATETDIPESVCSKKGEREDDDALPSEILEKVKQSESGPNQPLETSSHVADIVNTQLKTGIVTNEGGLFFQALSVPKVTADEESNKTESCEPTTTEDQEEKQTANIEAFTERKSNDDESVKVVASEEAFANDYEPNTKDHNVVEANFAQTEGSNAHALGLTKDLDKDMVEVTAICTKDESMSSSNTNTEAVSEEEPEFVKTKEREQEDIKEIRPSVEMQEKTNYHGLQDAITNDVCLSKQTEPEEKTTENEEKAIESHDGQMKMSGRPLVKEACEETDSEKPESDEGIKPSDSIASIKIEIVSKDENQKNEQAFKMLEKDQGDGDDVASSQDATCDDIKEMTGQQATHHLNESPREVFTEETEDESDNAQKASEQGEDGAKDKEQNLKESVNKIVHSSSEIEKEKETEEIRQSVEIEEKLEQKGLLHAITTDTCISTQTKSHVETVEHEVKDEKDANEIEESGSEKVEYDKEVKISDSSSIKLDEQAMTLLNKEENQEKEQEVNMSEKEQGGDDVTSSLDASSLQEKSHHSECNNPEVLKTKESTEEDNEEIRISIETPEKMEQQRLIDGIPTDGCISTHIKPEEETTENEVKNNEEAIESDDGQTKKSGIPMIKEVCVEVVSEKPESEEEIKLSDSYSMALNENEITRKDEDQEKEKELYVSQKGQGVSDDVTSSQNASTEHIKDLTSQDATTVACFEEAPGLNTMPKDILKEEAKDTTIDTQEASEQRENRAKDFTEQKPKESVDNSVLSCSEIVQQEDNEEIKPSVETEEKMEYQGLLHAIMTDTCITAQAESQVESAAHEEKNEVAIQNDDGQKEKPDNSSVSELCEELGSEKLSDISNMKQDEKAIAILSKVEDQGKEHEPSKSEKDQSEEDACISTQTESQVGIIKQEEKNEEEVNESDNGQKESFDNLSVKGVREETGSEKVEYEEEASYSDSSSSSMKLNEKGVTILSKDSEHEVNILEKDQGEDDVASSQDATFEEGLQEKNHQSESNEPEVVKTKESTKEDTEEIRSSVETTEETEQQRLTQAIPTDVCISTETQPEEGTTQNEEKNDEEAIESDGYTKKSGIPMVKEVREETVSEEAEFEERIKLSDSSNIALNENEIATKDEDQEKEQELYVSGKGEGGGDDVTSSQDATCEDIKETTIDQHVTTIAYFEEGQGLSLMPKEILKEEENKSSDAKEVIHTSEQYENGANDKREQKPEESVNKIVHSSSKVKQEEYTKDIKPCVKTDEKKPQGLMHSITTDACISRQTESQVTTIGHDGGHEEVIEDDDRKENSDNLSIKEVCEETHTEKVESEGVELSDNSDIKLNEKVIAILSKDEDQEKKQEPNMSEQKQGEDDVASSQDAIATSIKDLQAKNYEGEGKEPEDDTSRESIKEGTEKMRSSVQRKEEVKHQMSLHAAEVDEQEFIETRESIKENNEVPITNNETEELVEQEGPHHVITSDVCIAAQTESQEDTMENEEKNEESIESGDGRKEKLVIPSVKEVCNKISSEKAEGIKPYEISNIKLNEKAIATFIDENQEKDQEVNMIAEGQEKDNVTSSEEAELEEDFQEKKYRNEGNEPGFVTTRESVEEDTEEIKSSVETKKNLEQQGLLHVITTDACSSAQTEPKEETTENEEKNDTDAIENEDGRAKKSESPLVGEVREATGSEKAESKGVTTLNENEIVSEKVSQEKEQELKISEVQSGGDDVISSQDASSEDIKETTIGQLGVIVACFEEGQGLSSTKEILTEEAEDKSIDAQEAREQSENGAENKEELKSMESVDKPVHLYSEIVEGNIKEDKADTRSNKEEVYFEKSNHEAREGGDTTECEIAGGTQNISPENKDEATGNSSKSYEATPQDVKSSCQKPGSPLDEETEYEKLNKNEDNYTVPETHTQKGNVNEKVDEEQSYVTHEQRSIDASEQENVSGELHAQVEKELQEDTRDNNLDYVGSENPCTTTQDIIKAIEETTTMKVEKITEQDFQESQSKTNKEIEAKVDTKNEDDRTESKSAMKDEVILTEKMSSELGQPKEQNIQEIQECLTTSEETEDEITRKDDKLSHDSIKETTGNTTKDEKCSLDGRTMEIEISMLEHEPIKEQNSGLGEIPKEKPTDLTGTTVVEPQEDIMCFSSLGTSTEDPSNLEKAKAESENLPVEDLEHVSDVQILEVVPKSEDSNMKEECLTSLTAMSVEEEKRTVTKEISSDEKPEQTTEIKHEHPSIACLDAVLIEKELGRSSEKENDTGYGRSVEDFYQELVVDETISESQPQETKEENVKQTPTDSDKMKSDDTNREFEALEQLKKSHIVTEENAPRFEQIDENNSLCESRDMEEDVPQKHQFNSTEDGSEMVKDVILTKEIEQVPLEIQEEKGRNDFKEQILEEDSYSTEQQKTAQNQKDMAHEISYLDPIPIPTPEVREAREDAEMAQDLQAAKDISCESKASSTIPASKMEMEKGNEESARISGEVENDSVDEAPKEERIPALEDDATLEPQVNLSNLESTVYPSESEKLPTHPLDSVSHVQTPDVVVDSEDSKVKEECIVLEATEFPDENNVKEEQKIKTNEILSAEKKELTMERKQVAEHSSMSYLDEILVKEELGRSGEQENPKEEENGEQAPAKSDEEKRSDSNIEEKALPKENLELHGELKPTSESIIREDQGNDTEPQAEQSNITSINNMKDQILERKLEHTIENDVVDGKSDMEEDVTLAPENQINSSENQNVKVVVETEEEKIRNEVKGHDFEEDNYPTEGEKVSTSSQKELANETKYSKSIPVGNIEVTEVKAESQIELENIQVAEDINCLSKASSTIGASKLELKEGIGQTVTIIGEVKGDSVDETSNDETIAVLEDAKSLQLQVNLPEVESDAPTNGQEPIEDKGVLISQLTEREILEGPTENRKEVPNLEFEKKEKGDELISEIQTPEAFLKTELKEEHLKATNDTCVTPMGELSSEKLLNELKESDGKENIEVIVTQEEKVAEHSYQDAMAEVAVHEHLSQTEEKPEEFTSPMAEDQTNELVAETDKTKVEQHSISNKDLNLEFMEDETTKTFSEDQRSIKERYVKEEEQGDLGVENKEAKSGNEVLLEVEKAKKSTSIKDNINEEASYVHDQLTSATDEVCQIKSLNLSPNEFLETKGSVEDTQHPKLMAENLNLKAETFTVMQGANEDMEQNVEKTNEIVASEVKRLENMVTEEKIVEADANKKKETLKEPQSDDLKKTNSDSISSFKEQDIEVRSEESSGHGDMPKLEEKPTEDLEIMSEVAEIVAEGREVSAILTENVQEASPKMLQEKHEPDITTTSEKIEDEIKDEDEPLTNMYLSTSTQEVACLSNKETEELQVSTLNSEIDEGKQNGPGDMLNKEREAVQPQEHISSIRSVDLPSDAKIMEQGESVHCGSQEPSEDNTLLSQDDKKDEDSIIPLSVDKEIIQSGNKRFEELLEKSLDNTTAVRSIDVMKNEECSEIEQHHLDTKEATSESINHENQNEQKKEAEENVMSEIPIEKVPKQTIAHEEIVDEILVMPVAKEDDKRNYPQDHLKEQEYSGERIYQDLEAVKEPFQIEKSSDNVEKAGAINIQEETMLDENLQEENTEERTNITETIVNLHHRDTSTEAALPIEDVKSLDVKLQCDMDVPVPEGASTRNPEVRSADIEAPPVLDATADKIGYNKDPNDKTAESYEAEKDLLKEDVHLEPTCDRGKTTEEVSGMKQEPLELDATVTPATAATEDSEISQKYVANDLIKTSQIQPNKQTYEVTARTVDKQSPNKPHENESIKSKLLTGTIDASHEQGEPAAKSLNAEEEYFKVTKVSGIEPQCDSEVFKEDEKMSDEKEKSEPAKILFTDMLHESTEGNSVVAETLIEERENTPTKDHQVDKEETGDNGEKTGEDNEEEEDDEDNQKMGSYSDAPVMVEASKDMEVKAHKKSHNILSGVGSKVKHSIAKVKKAITGKSSHPKPSSPKERD